MKEVWHVEAWEGVLGKRALRRQAKQQVKAQMTGSVN